MAEAQQLVVSDRRSDEARSHFLAGDIGIQSPAEEIRMAALPYVTATGNIEKALKGIKAAATPESVSQDFVKTILGIREARALISTPP
jgi:hypothetical protein